MTKFMSITEAIDHSGPVIFPDDDWIGGLDETQCKLIATYGPQNKSIGAVPIKDRIPLERALGRDLRFAAQRVAVLDWMEATGLVIRRVHGSRVDGAALDHALALRPQTVSVSSGGPRPTKVRRVESAMRREIMARDLTVEQLEAMRHKEMAARFGASAGTCVKARKTVLRELKRA